MEYFITNKLQCTDWIQLCYFFQDKLYFYGKTYNFYGYFFKQMRQKTANSDIWSEFQPKTSITYTTNPSAPSLAAF